MKTLPFGVTPIHGIGPPFYGSPFYGQIVYGVATEPVPVQRVGWPEFFQALIDYMIATNIVGPGCAFWAIDPDSVIQWPSNPSPFLLLVPGRFRNEGTNEGGGRFVKTWDVHIEIHIVVNNIIDPAFQDTALVTVPDPTVGPYALLHLVIDKMEEADIRTLSGRYATVEFPKATDVGDIHHFKESIPYISLPVYFEMLVHESMPSTFLPVATPPTAEDLAHFPDQSFDDIFLVEG